MSENNSSSNTKDKISIAVIGCGWWTQGWHLPHLSRNSDKGVKIAALVDTFSHPRSTLNPNLDSLEHLSKRYYCPVFSSVQDMLQNVPEDELDGVIVCTPHSTHYDIGKQLLLLRPQLHILMEKPMTTDLEDAQKLHDLVVQTHQARAQALVNSNSNSNANANPPPAFLLNHSANYRPAAALAQTIVQSQHKIGTLRHVTASFASPLTWLFEDPANTGWNIPTGKMLGNGFAWGQSSHILAWIYHVTGLSPQSVYCVMTHSKETGADVSHAATITCQTTTATATNDDNNVGSNQRVTLSLSGTSLLPGNAHSDPPIGKLVQIHMYGDKGTLLYSGDDTQPHSGALELRLSDESDGKVEYQLQDQGFLFENIDPNGTGPESLHQLFKACRGQDYYVGADTAVGVKTVQTIEAMYKSHFSGNVEKI